MAIDLASLLPHLYGWRPDLERSNQAVAYDALQRAARMVASLALPLRESVQVTQAAGSAVVQPYLGSDSGKECIRVFSVRRIDPDAPDAIHWLVPVAGAADYRFRDPDTIPAGSPVRFVPMTQAVILDRKPEVETVFVCHVAYTLPMDTDIWPFPSLCEAALIDGALYYLLERPGPNHNAGAAREKRVSFALNIKNILGAVSQGFTIGDPAHLTQLPGVPLPD